MTTYRKGFKMQLLDGVVAEYRKRHDEIWPELTSSLKEAGISNYSIFLDDNDHTLFGVLTTDNPDALGQLPQQAVMKKWWSYMADLMETNHDQSPIETPLQEIFYLP